MPGIDVRMLAGADLAGVLAVWNRALVRDPINVGRLIGGTLCDADFWPWPDSGMFVAVRDGKLIGFLRAIVRRNPNDRVGLEPDDGWIAVMAVDPDHQRSGVGTALLDHALSWFRNHDRKRIWVCGRTGSAPGYVFCGVDKDAYPGGLALLDKAGFRVKNEPVAMSREIITFNVSDWRTKIGSNPGVQILQLTPERVPDFFAFMAEEFPGDWNTAARGKVRAAMHEVLVAELEGRIVGYCQWEGEHFGPFGVARAARNRKVGAALFVEAVARIKEADGRTVWFNWADEDAARFYRRFGLTATRRFAILTKDL